MNTELKIVELVKLDGMTRVYKMSDGTIQTWKDGTASWRHNNPGNMKFEYVGSADKTVKTKRTKEKALSDAKARYEGVIALDQRGNAIFESIAKGNQARFKLLKTSHGNKSIRTMLDNYAKDDYTGKTDNDAYAKSIYAVGEKRGLDIKNILIKNMNEAQFTALVDGMKEHEGFKAGTITSGNGTSVLVDAVDSFKNPYVGAKITISYQSTTGSKIVKSFTADEHGKIPSFDAPAGSVLSFTINGKSIDKTITLVEGKTQPLTLIDSTIQPIKAKTAVHDGSPQIKEKIKTEKKQQTNNENESKTITFDIVVIDAEKKAPLPKISYFLEYKGSQKAHQTDGAGVDRAIAANVGETIIVYVDGYNGHHQKVLDFTVSDQMGKINVKVPPHTFDIILRNKESPLVNYPFQTHYRGKVKSKVTNSLGKVTITALIGQEVLLKTQNGEKIISFIVDATKQIYSCLISGESTTQKVTEKTKVTTEEPKAAKPTAKDVSPNQSVIDEKSAKGNPVTKVKTNADNGNKTQKLIEILNKNVGFGSNKSPISGPTAVLASIKGENISAHTKVAGESLGQCYKYVKVGLL